MPAREDEDIELRFDEPRSIAEANELRQRLTQNVQELQAGLAAINAEKPPKHQTHNYDIWVNQRGRRKSALRKTTQHLQFVKHWLHQAQQRAQETGGKRPSEQIFQLSHTCRRLEGLYDAVGAYLDDDTDEAHARLVVAYNALAIEMRGQPAVSNTA